MKVNRLLIFIASLLFLGLNISMSNGYIILVHKGTMNITNSSGYTNNYNPSIIAYKVNDNITFTALAPDSVAEIILNNGLIKWDFGDLTETNYSINNRIVIHKYSFPFPYPVAWCGYLNNTGYSKALTYNWLVVRDVKNTKYIFNGSPTYYSKEQWNVSYNSSSNTVIIRYYSETPENYEFNGLSVDLTPVTINVSRDNIVVGDSVKFNYSISRNIILTVWCFGDGTFSFEKSPTHTYTKPGIYYPRVLLVDDYGRVLVGYLYEGIKVNRPIGGYFEPIRNESYVYNSSGSVDVEDIYAMAYKVNDTMYFEPIDASYSNLLTTWYLKYDYGDGNETEYEPYYYGDIFIHKYSYPFIYPICWMEFSYNGGWTAFSATLDYLAVGDEGNTIYEFIPNNTYTSKPKVIYDPTNHIVKFYFYSDNINKTVTLMLRQKVHYDVFVYAKEVNGGIQYSFDYPYGKPVFVFWSFGDGNYSLENNPWHQYSNDNKYYQAHVLIVDSNGVVSVGFGPVIQNNKIVSTMLYVEPTAIPVNGTVNVLYFDPYILSDYLDLYVENYNYNVLYESVFSYISKRWRSYWIVSNYLYYPGYVTYIGNVWNYSTYILNITYQFLKEGIYYIEGYDIGQFYPRMIKVINNHNPVAQLYVYPNPASYNTTVFFNPLNSYDPDAGRTLSDGSGYIISPTEPYASIYGFNLTVYDSSGNIVWNYTSNNGLTIVSHKFNETGNYTAVLTVWDGWGKTNTTSVTFTIINKPPIAEFTYSPNLPKVNQTITFVSLSYDPDGKIVKYVWNFGDGNIIETNSSNITHIYTSPGTYNVTLTVYDNLNSSSSITIPVNVFYIKANFTCPTIVYVNQPINFTDKSITIPGYIKEYIWNFEDGSTSNQPNPIHIYTQQGIYNVTLTIINNYGLSASTSTKVIVKGTGKYPPIARFTFTVNGLNVTFNASSSYDIDGKIVKYIWDFGDGTTNTTTNPIITHIYNKSGVYIVKLTVVDNDNLTGSTIRIVSVTNVSMRSIPIPLPIEIIIFITTLFSINYIMRRLK
ncbi:PKD domain-containing protein [Methanocaldococcus sp.]|uniref:PKD domain-containing protein n=1 Tax=Methanocaldococcus sp. TaxID=2152917 RepID=UPI00261E30A4|nr:PKD domain-containing protein [Methanocaldococcus sp.]MCQ6253958.1 PKD domain-containing protein [Methanocaldococcus sp.]